MKEVIYSKNFIEWYDKFYYDSKTTKKEIEFIKKIIGNAKSILDVCCGTGRHACLLSKKYSVTGIDLSKDMISYAKKKCPKVKFIVMNMKNIKLKEKFDTILMLGASFPYLITNNEIRKTLFGIKKILKDDGLFIFSVNIKKNKDVFKEKNIKFDYDVKKNNNILWIKTKIYRKSGGKYLKVLEDKKYIPRRIFTASEIEDLIKENGFRIKFNKLIGRQRFFVCEIL